MKINPTLPSAGAAIAETAQRASRAPRSEASETCAPCAASKDLAEAVSTARLVLREQGRELHLRVDRETGTVQAVILDPEKGQELRRIPSDELLRLAKAMKTQAGALFSFRL